MSRFSKVQSALAALGANIASLTTQIGASGLFGPNGTGADGRTYLYGADMIWKWQPPNHFRGWPFLTWQTEVMRRDYEADHFVDG